MSPDQPRQPGGTPAGGEFASRQHAEADVSLDGGGSTALATAPWEPVKVHDLVTSMAPRLAEDVAAVRDRAPDGRDPFEWRREVDSVRVAFESVDGVMGDLGEAQRVAAEARFEAGMTTLRAQPDHHLAAAMATTAATGLRSYAEMRRAYPEHMTVEEWNETLDTMIAGFDEATTADPDLDVVRSGVDAFARNYISLWS